MTRVRDTKLSAGGTTVRLPACLPSPDCLVPAAKLAKPLPSSLRPGGLRRMRGARVQEPAGPQGRSESSPSPL